MNVVAHSWNRPASRRSAFTLIELLVAVGITALLVALMLNVVIGVLNTWNRSSGTLSANSQAAILLNQLSVDLQGAIMKRDGNVWLAATIQRDQSTTDDVQMTSTYKSNWTNGKPLAGPVAGGGSLEVNPSTLNIADYRFGQAGVWLRLFTMPADNVPRSTTDPTVDPKNLSAPRAVSYQIVRGSRNAAGNEKHYTLFRSEVRPAGSTQSTFTAGYNLFMAASPTPSYNAGDAIDGNVGSIRRPSVSRIIANNVIDFGVKFYASYVPPLSLPGTPATMTEIFPIDRRGTPTTYGCLAATSDTTAATMIPPEGVPTAGPVIRAFPEQADVMVRVLTEEGARLIAILENPPSGYTPTIPTGLTQSQYWWQIAQQNSRVFTRRIQLKAQAF